MVKEIRIGIRNYDKEEVYSIDVLNEILEYNGIKKKIIRERVDKFLTIILNWNNSYIDLRVVDGEEYLIELWEENSKYIYKNNGGYPSNYLEFKKWIKEINE